jgi:hypothetical protein
MKAVRFSRFGGPEVLEIVDLPDPHPGPGQVRSRPGNPAMRPACRPLLPRCRIPFLAPGFTSALALGRICYASII